MSVHHITSLAELEKLQATNTYVVADFYADWCGPCKAIAPMYTNLTSTHSVPGQLAFAKVNVDNATDVAQKYGITAMPTFLFFKNSKPYSGRSMIRGADPRSLQATAQELGQLAKEAAATKSAGANAAVTPDDGSSVSGGYTLGGNDGSRTDWKMSLRG